MRVRTKKEKVEIKYNKPEMVDVSDYKQLPTFYIVVSAARLEDPKGMEMLIDKLAKRGLLVPEWKVYRYTHAKVQTLVDLCIPLEKI